MPVKYIDWFTPELVRDNQNLFFVFGDNARRVGRGGQAKACRGASNAIGVATLYAPGIFYDRSSKPLAIVMNDLAIVATRLQLGYTIIAPRDGLGTGLARLPEFRPDLNNLIVSFFKATGGETCPWNYV